MKIFVVGAGGGREHAIIKKLKQSPTASQIFCTPANAGIENDAVCFNVKAMDFAGVKRIADKIKPDLIAVVSDDPLCGGLTDYLEDAGFRVFGPRKEAAQIEGSKVFSKALMKKYKIPTAAYETFDSYENALAYIKTANYPAVIKADGLAAGKGVIIAENRTEAEAALKVMFLDKEFGSSGEKVVVEEFLTGVEISMLAFCDGKTIKPMVSAKDHKAVYDGDKGPNTGGMGAVAPHPLYDAKLAKICEKEIYSATLDALKAEGIDFRGVIFFGMIITKDGPKVFEYNARFGDPETQVVLPLLDCDLALIMDAVSRGELSQIEFGIREGYAACLTLASGGYPGKYEKGFEISGLDKVNCEVCHAGTILEKEKIKTSGGRVLGVVAAGNSLEDAINSVYSEAKKINFKNMYFRKDIGVIYSDKLL